MGVKNSRKRSGFFFSRAQNPHSLFFQTPATQAKARLISNAVILNNQFINSRLAFAYYNVNESIIT